MTSIRTDLSALTRDGLLQAYRDRVRNGVANIGDRVVVRDLTGDDEAYAAVVHEIDGDVLLLAVDWDDPNADTVIFTDWFGGTFVQNHVSSPYGAKIGIPVLSLA